MALKSKAAIGAAVLAGTAMILASAPAAAADWSDTSISLRNGSKFAEPFNGKDVSKNIIGVTHVSGYKYGTNFLNLDMLMSDKTDKDATGNGAQEAYFVYRNTVDFSKVNGGSYKYFGVTRDLGATFGFDWNTKNDVGYASKKRMFVAGPTVMLDVPGFVNVSVLGLWESNAPVGVTSRYSYKAHPALDVNWGIPLGATGLSFEGYADIIASKGKDEFGGDTATETHFDGRVMYDLGNRLGMAPKSFKVGFEYEWWKNKFGNNASGAAGSGAFAKTPMIRAEYHF